MNISKLEPNSKTKRTVLVVEDDFCYSRSLQMLLELFDCEVMLASNGEEGLSMVRQSRAMIDLVLLDIRMPIKSGIDFLVEANAENLLSDLPVYIQSNESIEKIDEAISMGASGYINKPYIKTEILKLIRGNNNGR